MQSPPLMQSASVYPRPEMVDQSFLGPNFHQKLLTNKELCHASYSTAILVLMRCLRCTFLDTSLLEDDSLLAYCAVQFRRS
jgi:hypothetical protein